MNNIRNNEILKTSIDQDGIFRLILNNQNNHNALSEEMMSNIQLALDESIINKKIRVIIISAEGPTFSAGHDLKELTQGRQNSDKGKAYFNDVIIARFGFINSFVNQRKWKRSFIAKIKLAGAQSVTRCHPSAELS